MAVIQEIILNHEEAGAGATGSSRQVLAFSENLSRGKSFTKLIP
jgi:hypothetical protein